MISNTSAETRSSYWHQVRPADRLFRFDGLRIDASKYRCILHWKDDLTLVVAWADDVKVCVIRRRPEAEAERSNLPSHYVEIGKLQN